MCANCVCVNFSIILAVINMATDDYIGPPTQKEKALWQEAMTLDVDNAIAVTDFVAKAAKYISVTLPSNELKLRVAMARRIITNARANKGHMFVDLMAEVDRLNDIYLAEAPQREHAEMMDRMNAERKTPQELEAIERERERHMAEEEEEQKIQAAEKERTRLKALPQALIMVKELLKKSEPLNVDMSNIGDPNDLQRIIAMATPTTKAQIAWLVATKMIGWIDRGMYYEHQVVDFLNAVVKDEELHMFIRALIREDQRIKIQEHQLREAKRRDEKQKAARKEQEQQASKREKERKDREDANAFLKEQYEARQRQTRQQEEQQEEQQEVRRQQEEQKRRKLAVSNKDVMIVREEYEPEKEVELGKLVRSLSSRHDMYPDDVASLGRMLLWAGPAIPPYTTLETKHLVESQRLQYIKSKLDQYAASTVGQWVDEVNQGVRSPREDKCTLM
jgi:hypothetical protein